MVRCTEMRCRGLEMGLESENNGAFWKKIRGKVIISYHFQARLLASPTPNGSGLFFRGAVGGSRDRLGGAYEPEAHPGGAGEDGQRDLQVDDRRGLAGAAAAHRDAGAQGEGKTSRNQIGGDMT